MSVYAQQIKALHDAVLGRDKQPALAQIKRARDNAFPPAARLAVYADGYVIRLVEASKSDYPALSHYLGEEMLDRCLHEFVRSTPSIYWDLNLYSVGLAEYMAAHHPDEKAVAIAHIEAAVTRVFWQPESPALSPEDIQNLPEEALAEQTFRLRDCVQLLALGHKANAYVTAFRAGENPTQIEKQEEYLCVARIDKTVKRLEIDAAEYHLLLALASGQPLGQALESQPDQEALLTALPHYMAGWLQNGLFKKI